MRLTTAQASDTDTQDISLPPAGGAAFIYPAMTRDALRARGNALRAKFLRDRSIPASGAGTLRLPVPTSKSPMPESPQARSYSAPALEKGMDIIELLAEAETGLTISEIAQGLGRRMSELFRIVMVMERRGWLQKNAETSRYNVTYYMLQLAHRSTPSQTLTSAATPVMVELSTHVNQSCHLVVRTGTHGLVILRQENQERHANFSVRTGAVLDLTTTCSGQVLLAHMNTEERDALLESLPRPRKGSRAKLLARLDKIKKRGYEVQPSQMTVGVTDLSYPIRGFDNKVVAALTIPYLHVIDDSLPTTVDQTRRFLEEAAQRISRLLGWVR